jgi:flagellin-like hook-associated protein FlgL
MMQRSYISQITKRMSDYNKQSLKVTTGRAYQKISENVTDGSRALRVREKLYRNEQVQRNIKSINEELTVAEGNLGTVKDIIVQVHADAIKIQNGTYNVDEHQAIATLFDSLKDEVLKTSNTSYGEHYVFSGVQNFEPPFDADEVTGEISFNGIPVKDIGKYYGESIITEEGVTVNGNYVYGEEIDIEDPEYDPAAPKYIKTNDNEFYAIAVDENGDPVLDDDGNYTYSDRKGAAQIADPESTLFSIQKVPYSDDIYIDGGLGMTVHDVSGLDKRSAIQSNINGLTAYGFGTKEVEYISVDDNSYHYTLPNNIYEMFDEMSAALRDGDMNKFAALDIQMMDQHKELLKEISALGVRMNYVDTNSERLETENITLRDLQQNVEGINDPTEITKQSYSEYAWILTLQFGSKYLPNTLMDYLG